MSDHGHYHDLEFSSTNPVARDRIAVVSGQVQRIEWRLVAMEKRLDLIMQAVGCMVARPAVDTSLAVLASDGDEVPMTYVGAGGGA